IRNVVLACALVWSTFASANVITDWDVKAVAFASPGVVGQREVTLVHVAMFDAVNSIERRYRPYLVQLTAAKTTSQEAAAATAAATVLVGLAPSKAAHLKAVLDNYLAAIADGGAKSDGIKLGRAVAAKILQARQNDGANATDAYRPKTRPGVYVPTPITVGSTWPGMRRLSSRSRRSSGPVRRSRSRARSGPPITTKSRNMV